MIKVYYKISKLNSKRRVINKGRKLLSGSFVKAFIQLLYCNIANLTYSITDVSGDSESYSVLNSTFVPLFFCNGTGGGTRSSVDGRIFYNAGNKTDGVAVLGDDIGVQVGTGTTAVTSNDISLESKILHGTSSGKLKYLGHFISDVEVSGSNAELIIERVFYNNSGGDVTVGEIGIYSFTWLKYYCILRDVLASPVTVSNGEYLKVAYTIQTIV